MHNIDILLPTYNGGYYLEGLLDSIINQSIKNWRLMIRDDSSTDNTVEIILEYINRFPDKIMLIENDGNRIGFLNNYSKLLEASDAEYIMFCDQDDIWLPDKIEKSIQKINYLENKFGKDIPLLVHSDLTVVDEKLRVIEKSFWKYRNLNPNKNSSLSRLLVQNVVTGCTIIMNKKLRDISIPIPANAIIHDWWFSLTAVAFGKIDFIREPLILYRQHENNVLGAKRFDFNYVLGLFVKNFLNNRDNLKKSLLNTQNQAQVFADKFRNYLSVRDLKLVSLYAGLNRQNFIRKRITLLKYGFFKNGCARNIGLFFLI